MPSRGQKYVSPFNSSYSLPYSHFHYSLFFIPSLLPLLDTQPVVSAFFLPFLSVFSVFWLPFYSLYSSAVLQEFCWESSLCLGLGIRGSASNQVPTQPTGRENIHDVAMAQNIHPCKSRVMDSIS